MEHLHVPDYLVTAVDLADLVKFHEQGIGTELWIDCCDGRGQSLSGDPIVDQFYLALAGYHLVGLGAADNNCLACLKDFRRSEPR